MFLVKNSSFIEKTTLLLSGFLIALMTLFSCQSYAQASKIFVSSKWLKSHQSKVKIIDMSDKSQFQKFHIEDALWVNYAWLIKPQNGLQLSGGADYMANVLSQLGIKNSDHLVIYDDMGGLEASRLYWELKKLNHAKVNILDGGIVSWILAGNKVTQQAPQRPAQSQYTVPKKHSTDALTADKKEVINAKQNNVVLLDTRTEQEYIGNPKQKRSGHIPAAIWFDWSKAIDVQNGFKQYSNDNLLQNLRGVSLSDLKQPIIVYCNTAHRAARSFVMLKSLGFENVKLYDGSIQEYEIDKSLPLKLGKQP